MLRTLLPSFMLCAAISYGQTGAGALKVSGFYNEDNKLKNNREIEQLDLCVIDIQSGDTLVHEQIGKNYRKTLNPGNYMLIATYQAYDPLVESVEIRADRITFADLLFEPKRVHRRKFATGTSAGRK